MLDFLMHLNTAYLYPVVLLGYIFLGGLVLIPSIFLTIVGTLNIYYLYITIIISSMLADTFWYYVGGHVKKESIYKIGFVRSKIDEAKQFSNYFTRRGVFLVFICKFIYGTRIASQILAGMHKINYFKFIGAVSAGTTTWFSLFYVLIKSLDMGISSAGAMGFRIQIIFLGAISVLLLINFITGRYLRKRFLRKNRSQNVI